MSSFIVQDTVNTSKNWLHGFVLILCYKVRYDGVYWCCINYNYKTELQTTFEIAWSNWFAPLTDNSKINRNSHALNSTDVLVYIAFWEQHNITFIQNIQLNTCLFVVVFLFFYTRTYREWWQHTSNGYILMIRLPTLHANFIYHFLSN